MTVIVVIILAIYIPAIDVNTESECRSTLSVAWNRLEVLANQNGFIPFMNYHMVV